MKGKNLIRRLFIVVLFILIFFIYVSVYVIPSIKHINLQKRNVKDLKFKIENFETQEEEISIINKREREFVEREEKGFKSKIPHLRSEGDIRAIEQKVVKNIELIAKKAGISNMIIKFHFNEPQVVTLTLPRGKGVLNRLKYLISLKGSEIKDKLDIQHQEKDPLISNLRDVNFFTAILTYEGNLKNSINFINQLPWQDYLLKPEDFMIARGKPFPFYILFVKVYYFDHRPEVEAKETSSPSDDDLIIDYHSPILLKPVYETYFEEYIAGELPPRFGREFLSGSGLNSKSQSFTSERGEITFQLIAIDTSGKENVAVINHTLVKTGDYISGLKVAKISAEAVVLKHKEKEIMLTSGQRVKKIKVY